MQTIYNNNNSMTFPKKNGIYIYEITSKWDDGDENGTASYVIKVEIR